MTTDRFVYVQVPRRRNPAIVAYNARESGNGQITIEYGVSFCHTKDRFDRGLGREIASGRLARRPLTEVVNFGQDEKFAVVVTEAVRNLVTKSHTQISSFYGRNHAVGNRALTDNEVELSLCDETGVYVSIADIASTPTLVA